MVVFLQHIELRYFRGIGETAQRLGPFRKFNFFIGANNSGKSTVLLFLASYLPLGTKELPSPSISSLDNHRGQITGKTEVRLGVSSTAFIENVVSKITDEGLLKAVEPVLEKLTHTLSENDVIWFDTKIQSGNCAFQLKFDTNDVASVMDQTTWNYFASWLGANTFGSTIQRTIIDTVNHLGSRTSLSLPSIQLIPTLRQIGKKGSKFEGTTGEGLIEKIGELQNPSLHMGVVAEL